MDALIEKLQYIPADDYQVWTTVGMALRHEGYGWEVWDEWSRSSPKYQEGVCERKWKSFNEGNAGAPATGGTIDHLARLNGWSVRINGRAGNSRVVFDGSKATVTRPGVMVILR